MNSEPLTKNYVVEAIDPITALYTGDELKRRIRQERERLARFGIEKDNCFSLLYIDIDNYRYYTINHGDEVGDLIVREFAGVIRKLLRAVDLPARVGGDEFAVLLVHTNSAGAQTFCDRLHQDLELLANFQHKIEEFLNHGIEVPLDKRLTCSIGITVCKPGDERDEAGILESAKTLMEEAKKLGKNRCLAEHQV